MGVCCRVTGLPNPSVPWWGHLIFLQVPPALEAHVRSGAEAGGGGVSSWSWRVSLRHALRLARSPESGEAPTQTLGDGTVSLPGPEQRVGWALVACLASPPT